MYTKCKEDHLINSAYRHQCVRMIRYRWPVLRRVPHKIPNTKNKNTTHSLTHWLTDPRKNLKKHSHSRLSPRSAAASSLKVTWYMARIQWDIISDFNVIYIYFDIQNWKCLSALWRLVVSLCLSNFWHFDWSLNAYDRSFIHFSFAAALNTITR